MDIQSIIDDVRRTIESAQSHERSSSFLRQQRQKILDATRSVTDAASRQDRDMTTQERRDFTAGLSESNTLSADIAKAEQREVDEARGAVPVTRNSDAFYRQPSHRDRSSVVLRSNQSLAEHVRAQGYGFNDDIGGSVDLGLGKMIRGMLLGDWRGADAERRSLLESNAGSGGVLVPAPLAAKVLDKARAQTRIIQAGARTVPMDSSTLKIGRQTGDPSLEWHTEGEEIEESGLTFDSVTLNARTLPCIAKFSIEILEDVDNIDTLVTDAIAKAMALELDRVGLRGSGTAPEPKGIRFQTGVTILNADESGGANGSPATWRTLARAVAAVKTSNFQPNASIHAVRTEIDLGMQTDGEGRYLAAPPLLDSVNRYDTTQVPTNLTKGTSVGVASEIYVGQWSELLIGMRTSFVIQPLNELYADTGERGVLCYLRADVAPAHAAAFAVVDGVTPTPAEED